MMETKWVRKLSPLEVFYEMGQRHGTLMTSYHATLQSKTSPKEEDVSLALQWLYKKTPSLRLCVRERKEELWFAEMEEQILEVEICHEGTVNEIMHSLTHNSYDSSQGPLWRAKLLLQCDSVSPSADFPVQFHFFIGICHTITDGFSNLKIIDFFVQILNNVLKDPSALTDQQLAIFTTREETEVLILEQKNELSDCKRLEEVRKEVMECMTNENTLWLDSFGINDVTEDRTLHMEESLDQDTTQKLLGIIKSKGVSVNSTICAMFNLLMVEMMQEKGLLKDSYNIGTLHGVNLRQFWNTKNPLPVLGTEIGIMRVFIETLSKNDFWEYAEKVNTKLKDKIKSKYMLNEMVAQGMGFKSSISDLSEMFSKGRTSQPLLYTASSLGNLDKMVDTGGQYVQCTAISRTTSHHRLACPLAFNFHTFRQRFNYSIEYCPMFVSQEVAKLIMFLVKKKIMNIVNV